MLLEGAANENDLKLGDLTGRFLVRRGQEGPTGGVSLLALTDGFRMLRCSGALARKADSLCSL